VLYVVDAACQNRFEDVKNALGELDDPIPFLCVALIGGWCIYVCLLLFLATTRNPDYKIVASFAV
jgi:hypothetical protein